MNIFDKNQYRKSYVNHTDTNNFDKIIIKKIGLLLAKLKNIKTIGIYYSLKSEVDITSIIKFSQYNFALPKIIEDKLQFCSYHEYSTLEKDRYKIYVPQENLFVEPDVIIVPGKAFDIFGHRIGSGKGFYDAYIRNSKNLRKKIGVCYNSQLYNYIKPNSYDQKMDYMVTEEKLLCL